MNIREAWLEATWSMTGWMSIAQGHILLGAQIFIGGFIGLIGCYLVGYAFGESRPRNPDAGVSYMICGYFLMGLGTFLIFGMQFTPLAVRL